MLIFFLFRLFALSRCVSSSFIHYLRLRFHTIPSGISRFFSHRHHSQKRISPVGYRLASKIVPPGN